MHKLVVFGSARVDAFINLPPDQTGQLCDTDEKKCFIKLSYAGKIPAENVEFLVGGNGANVAVGTKRLGVDSILVAELGVGPLANHVVSELDREIDTKYLSQTKGVKQGFGAVIVYQGERTILSYYPSKKPPFPKDLEISEWAYLTSVGKNFEGFFEDVYKWHDASKTRLVFNPGSRQIAKGTDWLAKHLEKTYLIFINRQEAEGIVDMSESFGKERELLDRLCSMGPQLAVVTDGREGSFAKDGDKYFKVGTLPIDAIERTGAGDAFSTACLADLIKGSSLQEGVLCGTINSASVIGYVGPQAGLLTKDKMKEWVDRAKSSDLKVEEL